VITRTVPTTKKSRSNIKQGGRRLSRVMGNIWCISAGELSLHTVRQWYSNCGPRLGTFGYRAADWCPKFSFHFIHSVQYMNNMVQRLLTLSLNKIKVQHG